MSKFLVFLLAFLTLVSCSSANDIQLQENRAIKFTNENFAFEMENVINQLGIYNPEISKNLKKCELGYALPDGYQVSSQKEDDTCLILFVEEDLAKNSEFLGQVAPFVDMDTPFVVAMTQEIVGPEYPFIFVGDNILDLHYLIRVMGHEGYHMVGIKNRTDCVSSLLCEEVNAYIVHFEILEKMYGKEYPSPQGRSLASQAALEIENFLYNEYKKGSLLEALVGMEYPDN